MRIILTVDRIEGDWAILKTEEGKTINWPKNKIPKEAKEGSVLNFEINDDKKIKEKKQNVAKDILNEILDA